MPPLHRFFTPWLRSGLLAFLCAALGCSVRAATVTVYHPPPEVSQDLRNIYQTRLLALALKKAGGQFVAEPAARVMPKARAIIELAQGVPGIDILWAMTNVERELQLLPIRIPIDKGLGGWRIALVRRQDADRLSVVQDVTELKPLLAGQGHDWPDLKILQAAGLTVTGVNSYVGLFSMLGRGRIDYLPRGINEVASEMNLLRTADLVVDEHIALHYPAAMYFFVSRSRPDLALAVQQGLELAIKDGSFEALFQSVHGARLKAARVQRRRVIELPNPYLPAQTPLQRAELWWRPLEAETAAAPGSKPAQR